MKKGAWKGLLLLTIITLFLLLLTSESKMMKERTRIVLQLAWRHSTEFAGFYAAHELGAYHENGIEVDFKPYYENLSISDCLLSGSADIAIIPWNAFWRDLDKISADITVLGAICQMSPMVLFSSSDINLERPSDLKGLRVLRKRGFEASLDSLLVSRGISSSAVKFVTLNDSFDMTPFLSGDIDVWAGYAMEETVAAEMHGIRVKVLYLAEYGFDNYDMLIVGAKKRVISEDDTVERFMEASRLGWKYLIEEPDGAAALCVKWIPERDARFIKSGIIKMAPLLIREGAVCQIEPLRWRLLAPKPYPFDILYRGEDD